MGRFKIYAYISMDGFVSRIDGDMDWMMRYAKGKDYGFDQFRASVGAVVCSSRHYATLHSNGDKWQYGDLPCYIVTRYPAQYPGDRNIHFISTDNTTKLKDCKEIAQLRAMEKDIWIAGDKELVTEFLEMGLIDEVTLIRIPVTLGNGLQLASHSGREIDWKILDTEKYDNDVIRTHYYRKRQIRK